MQEIELKLTTNQEVINGLKQELSHFRLLKHYQTTSQNCYFDTEDYFFSQQRMGLRVRKEDDVYTMTLKTAGIAQGGLHMRPEYNVRLSQQQPDLKLFSQFSELTLARPYEELQRSLQPIFYTDFQREYYLLETGNGTQLEIAIDQGEIKANNAKAPICEVEFELKSGNVEDVLNFVQHFLFLDGMRLGQISKAERGYRLAGITPKATLMTIDEWRQFLEQVFQSPQQQLKALFQYELKLLKNLEKLNLDLISQNQMETTALIGLFFTLYQHSCEQEVLFAQFSDKEDASEMIEINLFVYQQIRKIIAQHVEQQDNHIVLKRLVELTSQGRYLQKMINLLKMTLK
ncbi:CYTH domain-containing protein [Gallibacterium sp. ZY190522]